MDSNVWWNASSRGCIKSCISDWEQPESQMEQGVMGEYQWVHAWADTLFGESEDGID